MKETQARNLATITSAAHAGASLERDVVLDAMQAHADRITGNGHVLGSDTDADLRVISEIIALPREKRTVVDRKTGEPKETVVWDARLHRLDVLAALPGQQKIEILEGRLHLNVDVSGNTEVVPSLERRVTPNGK